MADGEDMETVFSFMEDCKKNYTLTHFADRKMPEEKTAETVQDIINDYQDGILAYRRDERRKERIRAIDREMEKFGELPEDFDDFIRREVFDGTNYIFYDRKKRTAYCSKCESDYVLTADIDLGNAWWSPMNGMEETGVGAFAGGEEKMHHNGEAVCPVCRRRMICKAAGRGRNNLTKVQWSTLLEPHGDELLVRNFCHIKSMQDYRKPEYRTFEKCRSIFTANGAKHYEDCYSYKTDRCGWNIFREHIGNYFVTPSKTIRPEDTTVYLRNMKSVMQVPFCKYSALDDYLSKAARRNEYGVYKDPFVCEHYLNAYGEFPYIEKLIKVGLYEIVNEKMKGISKVELKDMPSVVDVLGLNRTQYHYFMGLTDPDSRALKILQTYADISEKEFRLLYEMSGRYENDSFRKIYQMKRYATLHKLNRYFTEQEIKYIRDYEDYIGFLEKLGYDMKNEFNLFPKDFQKAHDEKAREYVKHKDEIMQEERRRFDMILAELSSGNREIEALKLEMGGLFVRLPKALEELKQEGETLHHCVGTYIDRVAEGKTMIFFIRRAEEPDKPYYTLEWNGHIVQCRGYRNGEMTENVKAFTSEFDRKMRCYETKSLPLRPAA